MIELPLDEIIRRCDAMEIPVTLAQNDAAKFPLLHANAAFETLTGYQRSQIVGKSCRFLQGRATDRAVSQHIRHSLLDEQSVSSVIANYRKSGELFHNFLIIEPLTSRDGPDLFVGFQYEVTNTVQLKDLHDHLNTVRAVADTLSISTQRSHDQMLIALRQRSDVALLALKIFDKR